MRSSKTQYDHTIGTHRCGFTQYLKAVLSQTFLYFASNSLIFIVTNTLQNIRLSYINLMYKQRKPTKPHKCFMP